MFTKLIGSPTQRLVEKLKSAFGDGTNVIVKDLGTLHLESIPITLSGNNVITTLPVAISD